MNIRIILLSLIFVSQCLYALAVKIDPLLKIVMVKQGVVASSDIILPKFDIIKSNNFIVSVSIISSDSNRTAIWLKSKGYSFRVFGNILFGRIDMRDIQELTNREEVAFISPAVPKRLYLDKSIPFIKGDLVHSVFRLPFKITGQGVVLGITDTGLDYTHQDFITDNQEMRTKYIWYQDVNGGLSPEEFGYGDECNTERISKKECPYKDVIGHGTHCSGIMGSDSKRYKGVAPDGVFVVAKSGTFENLIDGIEYVLKRAKLLNKPVVINMSLGGHYGPHDGNSPEELAIAEMLEKGNAKGKVIVVAAGNEGSSNIHLGYMADSSPRKTIMNIKNSSGLAIINLWRENNKELKVSIGITKDGSDELAETELFSGEGNLNSSIFYNEKKYAEVAFEAAYYPPSDKVMYLILINKNCNDCVSSGLNFYIKTIGNTYFDAWFADEDFFSGGSSFSTRSDNGLVPGDSKRTIGMPASSPYVITVAAAVSRKEYTDIDRNVHTLKDNPGEIAYFSSIGPTGDEFKTGLKPDITAPGRIIISSFSSDAIQLQAGTQVDRFHIAMQGTSMACPHVAGLVGLLLSINPSLTSNEAKRIIRLTASPPYDGFSGFDYRWGYGLVNAYEAVRMALKIGVCEDERDCKSNMVCKKNYCRGLIGFECESNLDCDSSLTCEEKKCLSPYNGSCIRNDDCIQGLECVESKCVYPAKITKGEEVDKGIGCSCDLVG